MDLLDFILVILFQSLVILYFVTLFIVLLQTFNRQRIIYHHKAALYLQGFDSGKMKKCILDLFRRRATPKEG